MEIPTSISSPPTGRLIQFNFRFPVEQRGPFEVMVCVPSGNTPILSPQFAKEMQLTDREIDEAETEVLRSIAVVY